MSEMKLSPELVEALHQAVKNIDPEAEDAGVFCQYLSAVIGFQLGVHDMPMAHKQQILQQMFEFAGQVLDDVQRQQADLQRAAPPADAMGIWRPQ